MKKTLQVAAREFINTVATKAFVVGLVIIPVIIVITIIGMRIIVREAPPRVEGQVAVIDPTAEVIGGLRESLQPEAIAERRDDFTKLVEEHTPEGIPEGTDPATEAREQAMKLLLGQVPKLDVIELEPDCDLESAKATLFEGDGKAGSRLVLVVVHDDAVVRAAGTESFGNYDFYIRAKLDDRIEREIKSALRNSIVEARVRLEGLDRAYIDSLTQVSRVRSITVTEEGEEKTNKLFNLLLPIGFLVLLFASVMTGGLSLMTTTVEEKASRVVEIMLSAVSPMQFMAGKIFGQMLVGFVILAVYGGMGMLALVVFAMLGVFDLWLLFYLLIFYFIAYFTVAAMFGAIGAAVNEIREAQGLQGPVMMILMIPWLLWMPIARNPDSVFAVVTSFLPPLNPFVMLIRMTSSSPPPLWQVWLSIAVGAVSAYVAIWFAGKVFRIGLLMYGKPPNFKTLIKWVRMA